MPSSRGPREEPSDEGERMSPELARRVRDIEEGRVEMKRYTLDEYMRHLDELLRE